MKKILFLLIGICVLISCKENEIPEIDENCIFKTELTAPEGFEINLLSSIDFNGQLSKIQFLDKNNGYILGTNNVGGAAEVFRTNNGGESWTDLNLQNRINPHSMFFLTKDKGFISYYEKSGNLLITEDGGINWEVKEYENIIGSLHHIQSDGQGNLYACTFDLNSPSVLVKSIDEGQSWNIINNSSEIQLVYSTFSFKIFEDQIYISGKDGKLIVTDFDGSILEIIHTGLTSFFDIEIVDNNNIIINNGSSTIKTKDGGLNWATMYDKRASIINFLNAESGLMLLNKSFCPVDYPIRHDVIAFTKDGGVTWVESQEYTNLILDYSDSKKIEDGVYIMILKNELYRITEE